MDPGSNASSHSPFILCPLKNITGGVADPMAFPQDTVTFFHVQQLPD
jgi:hypothetical protein